MINKVRTASTNDPGRLAFEPAAFLAKTGLWRTIVDLKKQQRVFSQGDPANEVFYIQKGRIKLTVISKRGKEATIAFLRRGMHRGDSAAMHGHCHRHYCDHRTQD